MQQAQFHIIRLDNPDAAIQSASLNALLKEGWTVIAHFVGEVGGAQCLILLMSPPKKLGGASYMDLAAVLLMLIVISILIYMGWGHVY